MPDDVVLLIEQWLRQKYVVRADERQALMGLSYVTAGTNDLARNIGKLVLVLTKATADKVAESAPLAALSIALSELGEAYKDAQS